MLGASPTQPCPCPCPQRLADGTVPERLKGKRLVALNLGLLLADTKYRGDFEENIKNVLEEARGRSVSLRL